MQIGTVDSPDGSLCTNMENFFCELKKNGPEVDMLGLGKCMSNQSMDAILRKRIIKFTEQYDNWFQAWLDLANE